MPPQPSDDAHPDPASLGITGDPTTGGPCQLLLRDLQGLDYDRRQSAFHSLVDLGAAAIPALIRALSAPSGELRAASVEVLGAIRAHATFPRLVHVLRDPDESVREAAVRALGLFGDARAVEPLCELLATGTQRSRWHAAGALGSIGDLAAASALRRALSDADPSVRERVIEALVLLGEDVLEATGLGSGGKLRLGLSALTVLERLGHCPPASSLEAALRHPNPEVRRRAAGLVKEPIASELVEVLCEGLADAEVGVRRAAAAALARGSAPRAVPALCVAIGDADGSVSGAASTALERIGTFAVPFLCQLLDDREPHIRGRAARTLVRIGLPSVAPFCTLLTHDDAAVRVLAAQALHELADRCPVPALRAALPELRRLESPWLFGSDSGRRAYRAARKRIEAATAHLRDLPAPGHRPRLSATSLPLPADPPPPGDGDRDWDSE